MFNTTSAIGGSSVNTFPKSLVMLSLLLQVSDR